MVIDALAVRALAGVLRNAQDGELPLFAWTLGLAQEELVRLLERYFSEASGLTLLPDVHYAQLCRAAPDDFLALVGLLRDQRDEDERVLRGALAELSAANEELRRVDAFKDQVIAMTSHELRTPLTSILGYTSLLLEAWDDEDRESGRRWAETVDRQTRRLIRLVEDLLTLSRLEGGRLELDLEPVAVESIVAATVEGLPQRARVDVEGVMEGFVLAEPVRGTPCQSPRARWRSEWHTPDALIRINASSSCGSGTSRSWMASSPSTSRAAFMTTPP